MAHRCAEISVDSTANCADVAPAEAEGHSIPRTRVHSYSGTRGDRHAPRREGARPKSAASIAPRALTPNSQAAGTMTASMPAELVRADDLGPWSDRLEAMAVLPELVRRLLWASAFPRKLEFRAEAGVRAPGFDGVLDTHLEGAYWPSGTSIWELSVRSDAGTKANEDYKTRINEVPPEARAQLAYVAVTSRRWAGKEDWVGEKRAEGSWADVRVLDADNLAAWIATAPAVALWFASTQFGRPVDDEIDVGSYVDSWAQRTQPPLPGDLPSRGVREQAAQQLVAVVERAGSCAHATDRRGG